MLDLKRHRSETAMFVAFLTLISMVSTISGAASALLGDINVDGSVDVRDLSIVTHAVDSHPGDESWNPFADLNNDKVINIVDIATVAKHFGESAQQPPDQPPENGLTVGVDLWCGTTQSTFLDKSRLPLMQQCGIQMVRLEFNRDSVANLRRLVPTTVNNGIEVLGLLMRKDLNNSIDAWGGWVYSVVSEFKDYVHVWECWNEPNLDEFFSGADPVVYTSFLKSGYNEAKRADPTCVVLGGSIVFTQRSSLDFLTAMYESGAKDYMDALSYHPYCTPYSPINNNTFNAYSRLETRVRPIMVQNGDENKKIWITEMGWGTEDVTEDQQATYLTQALAMAQNWGWVETFIIYKWIDSGDCYKGLLSEDGSPKPSFYAVKDFING